MHHKSIRAAALLLALILTAALLPVPVAEAASDDLSAVIERQIRAYADSIDQKDADDTAAQAIAAHGIKGGGKKLSVGASHALTATIFNSEIMQTALTQGCTVAIQTMQNLGIEEIPYIAGGITWGLWEGEGVSNYYLNCYSSKKYEELDSSDNLNYKMALGLLPSKQANAYDNSLEWIASFARVVLEFRLVKVTNASATYQITCSVQDTFDFNTASNSGFKNLISVIGALLFKEFIWESTTSFELTVPYSCNHGSGQYQWSYNKETNTLSPTIAAELSENGVVRHQTGGNQYYYELDSTLRLFHDQPWVIEYDAKNPGDFILTAFERFNTSRPAMCLIHQSSENISFWNSEYDGYATHSYEYARIYHGADIGDLCNLSNDRVYTYRLENEVSATGDNMIYLTILDTATGNTILAKTAMNNCRKIDSKVNDASANCRLPGQDLFIKYIGSPDYPLTADYFDLRIWENGEGGESYDYFEAKTVAPTCAGEGYTAHTCAACGYSYKTDIVPAKPHTYTTKVTKPTCTEKGHTTYTCTTCGYSHKADIVPAKGHDYITEVTPPTCTEEGYTTYTCTVCNETHVGDTVKALKHSYGAGYCSRCGDDTVTAAIVGGYIDLRATKGIKVGTWVLVAGYTANGRMTGFHARLWDGTPQTLDLPIGEKYVLYFVKEGTWEPLRLPVIPQ